MRWTKTNKKRLGIASFFGVLFMSLLTLTAIFQPFASAVYLGDRPLEYGYFYNQYTGGRSWHDVIPGGIPNTADKNTFISFITNKYYNGSQQEKTGAAFIINLQLGNSGSGSNRGLAASDINGWAVRLQQAQVSFSMENYSYSYNSAYDTPTDDDLFYAEGGTRWSLVIRYNGVIVSVIKQDCANPLDGNPGVPIYNPSWTLSSNATANVPNAFPGQTVTFNYTLRNNGPDTAHFQYVTRVQEYVGGAPQPVWSWPVPNAVEGGLPAGASEPSYSVRSYTVPGTPGLNRVCSWIEYAGWASYDGNPASSRQACVNIISPVATCTALNIIPGNLQPGSTFSTYASVTYQNQAAASAVYASGGRLFVTVTGPNGYSVDSNTGGGMDYGPPSAADISGFSPTFPAVNAGTYNVTYGIRGGTIGNKNCTTSFSVAYHPFFNVKGGDVSAGNGFDWGGACTGTDNASIASWNRIDEPSSTDYGGGTAGLAAFATANNGIQHFVTAADMSGGAGNVGGHGLSFANYEGSSYVANPVFGDSYGTADKLPCVHDYQADAPTKASLPLAGTILTSGTLSGLGANNYEAAPANITIGDGSDITLTAGRKVTVYVNGDVYIKNNIRYSYNNIQDIPMFRLIVKGGIYIDGSVTELHGVYIAQAKAATGPQHAMGGIFSSCASGPGTAISQYSTCNNQLTVVGAVAAENQILLGRNYGSIVANPPSVTADPAEVFQYSPELWLNTANGPALGPLTYQAFTSLPPVL